MAGKRLIVLTRSGQAICLASPESGAGLKPALEPQKKKEVTAASIKKGRRAIRKTKERQYKMGDGIVSFDASCRTATFKAGKTSEVLFKAPQKWEMTALDVIEKPAAFLAAYTRNNDSIIYLKGGADVVTIKIDALTCMDGVLSKDGHLAAVALAWGDGEISDAKIRIYEVATGKQTKEINAYPDDVLPANMTWVDEMTVAFQNANPGHEAEDKWFVCDLASETCEELGT